MNNVIPLRVVDTGPAAFVRHLWAWQNDLLSGEECDRVIALGESAWQAGTTLGDKQGYRHSDVHWIGCAPETQWLYNRIGNCIDDLNRDFLGFEWDNWMESMQLTRYRPGGHYKAHCDASGDSQRKLSLALQLSDPADYEGGDLELLIEEPPLIMERKKGRAVVFPSYTVHRVTPVTRGERFSLVVWGHGPLLR